ncbi:uncharacterized protein LOC130655502 [Hydractinia symbiolongicarpus]|uniref:uncharacterized protein LOC130655502 n=1 Tax=Hydractinia symbiolongicarpus TaxID=13093 RepID=UPI00254B6C4D|nr:uncharacterized protein LOC130655502 [Hydractinia symbiolongicarpus]
MLRRDTQTTAIITKIEQLSAVSTSTFTIITRCFRKLPVVKEGSAIYILYKAYFIDNRFYHIAEDYYHGVAVLTKESALKRMSNNSLLTFVKLIIGLNIALQLVIIIVERWALKSNHGRGKFIILLKSKRTVMDFKCLLLLCLFVAAAQCYHKKADDELDEFADDVENEDEIELQDKDDEAMYKLKQDPAWGRRRRRRRSCSRRRRYSSCSGRHNGCGSDATKNVPAPYKSVFKPACNKHDVCYNCGKLRGWTQKECDERFRKDMLKICSCKYDKWYQAAGKTQCQGYAYTYYGIVRAAGSNFYLKNSHDYCSNDCVLRRGSAELAL